MRGGGLTFDSGLAGLVAGSDELQGGEALDTLLTAELLVALVITVDGGYFGNALEVFGGLFVFWLEVLAVSTYTRITVSYDDFSKQNHLASTG